MSEDLQLLARANPAPAGDGDRLDPDALATLGAITSGRARQTTRAGQHRWRAVSAAAAGAAAVLILTVGIPGLRSGPTPAHAATPPLLRFEAVTVSATDAARQLSEASRSSDPLDGEARDLTYQSWSLFTRIDDEQATSAVLPEATTVDRQQDGGVRLTVVQGEPYFPTPQHEDAWRAASMPGEPAGGTLRDETYGPDQYSLMYPDPPPTTATDMRPYLEVAHPVAELGTAELFVAITDLANEWRLAPAQRAAVLEVLAAAPDVEVLGTTADRSGRPAVAFGVTSELGGMPERRILLFSRSSGEVLASETWLTQDDGGLDVPVPGVIAYTVWGN